MQRSEMKHMHGSLGLGGLDLESCPDYNLTLKSQVQIPFKHDTDDDLSFPCATERRKGCVCAFQQDKGTWKIFYRELSL